MPYRYYITGAPQCVYPDASLGAVLNAVAFDAVYVQFCTSLVLCSYSVHVSRAVTFRQQPVRLASVQQLKRKLSLQLALLKLDWLIATALQGFNFGVW